MLRDKLHPSENILVACLSVVNENHFTGLFGETRAIALVLDVIKVAASLTDGLKPFLAVVTRGTVVIPSMFKVILRND